MKEKKDSKPKKTLKEIDVKELQGVGGGTASTDSAGECVACLCGNS